jgi:hypothetical protein
MKPLTEEDVKRNRLLNRIIIVGMVVILAGITYTVVDYLTDDTAQSP